jgi:hypothetical protein
MNTYYLALGLKVCGSVPPFSTSVFTARTERTGPLFICGLFNNSVSSSEYSIYHSMNVTLIKHSANGM